MIEHKIDELRENPEIAQEVLEYAKSQKLDNFYINYVNYNLNNFYEEYKTNIYFYNNSSKIDEDLNTDDPFLSKMIHLAKMSASDDTQVTVFCNIKEPSLWNCKLSNPRFVPFSTFHCSPVPDKLVYFESYDFITARDKCNELYFVTSGNTNGSLYFIKCVKKMFFISEKAVALYKANGNKMDTPFKIININEKKNRPHDVCYIKDSDSLYNIILNKNLNVILLSNSDDGKFKGEVVSERRKQNDVLLNSKVCIYDGNNAEIKKRILSRGCTLLSNDYRDNVLGLTISDGLTSAINTLVKSLSTDDSSTFLSLLD